LRLAAVLLALAGTVVGWKLLAAEESHFIPAFFQEGGVNVFILFPWGAGRAKEIALQGGLRTVNLIAFGPDGKSAYLQVPSAWIVHQSDSLIKVEFSPTRQSPVPGSEGLGNVLSLTVSPAPGHIFVWTRGGRDHPCGAYEIDPGSGTNRLLGAANGPGCGSVGVGVVSLGRVSPDGKELLSSDGVHLSLINLETGAQRPLGEGLGSWSPDGRWIAVAGHGRIVLIDARNPSHRKKLGASGINNDLIWSPDSRLLLFATQEGRCSFLFFGDDSDSLEVVDVETGKRHAVKSAHCAVGRPVVGWVDPEVVR
jgi:WD40 repeat protein